MVDTILADAEESGIGINWYLINNQSTCNAFINGKYLSKIRNAPNGKYLRVQCNSVVTYTNRIGDLPGYSNPVYFDPKGVSKIISLGLVYKHQLVTYNSQGGDAFVVHIPQSPTLNMIITGLFYHNIRHLLKIITRTSW